MRRSAAGIVQSRSGVQPNAVRDLFRQQADRTWSADVDLDWSTPPEIPESKREPWLVLFNSFYALELMGLDVL